VNKLRIDANKMSYHFSHADRYNKRILFYLVIELLVLFTYTLFTYFISYAYNINLYYVIFLDLLSYILFYPFLVSLIKNGSINILEPIYIVNGTFYLYFVLQPSINLLTNNKYFFGINVFPELPLATIYLIVGMIMLMIGYYSKFDISIIKKLFPFKYTDNSSKAVRYALILIFIGFVMFYLYTKILGISFIGLVTLNLINGSVGKVVNLSVEQINPFINYLYSSNYFLIGGFMILYAFQKRWRFLLLPLFLIIFFLFSSIGFRFILVIFFLSVFFYEYLKRNTKPKLINLIVIIVIMFFIVGGIGAIRDSIRSNNIQSAQKNFNLENIILQFDSNLDIYQPFYSMILNIPKYHNYLYGYTYYLALISFIPRGLWPNRPTGIPGMRLAIFAGDPLPFENGVAYPIIGDFYINFGLLGIIIFMFISGLFLKVLWKYFEMYKNSNWAKIIFLLSSTYLIQVISRGWPPEILQGWFFIVFPVIFGQWLTSRFSLRSKQL